ncbi:coproporphyrinogen III oxidase, partial [Mesorhizobium sp. M7A.F.Ca.CA.004.05.2.1]
MERPEIPTGLPADIEQKKMKARLWFEALRERICATFEQIEQDLGGPLASW